MIRDQALAVSGLLVEKVGGPSVKPYQPAGLWQELAGGKGYEADKGEGLYRRSLYTYWKRTVAPPFMMNFDSPNRETCTVRETRTNTPLQALNLMNDVTFLEASRKLAERMMTEGGVDPERASIMLAGWCWRAPPKPAEKQIVLETLQRFETRYRGRPEGREEVLDAGRFAARANARCRGTGGVYRRRQPDSESGRDDHEGMICNRTRSASRAAISSAAAPRASAWLRWRACCGRRRAGRSDAADFPGLPHFAPKAKRVIYLFQSGGPSQMELFDYKPRLMEFQGTDLPESIRKGQRLTGMSAHAVELPGGAVEVSISRSTANRARGSANCCRTPRKIADDLTFIKSREHRSDQSRSRRSRSCRPERSSRGRPSMGVVDRVRARQRDRGSAGVRGDDLAGLGRRAASRCTTGLWGSGFLPSRYQGVKFRSVGDPVLYLSNPPGFDRDDRRDYLDALAKLNQHAARRIRRSGNRARASRSTRWRSGCRPRCRN